MKALLLNSISRIMNYAKHLMSKTTRNIKFQGDKNEVIKVMYVPMLENKRKEQNKLLIELNNIKVETGKLNRKIRSIKEENLEYSKKVNTLSSFQEFYFNNH